MAVAEEGGDGGGDGGYGRGGNLRGNSYSRGEREKFKCMACTDGEREKMGVRQWVGRTLTMCAKFNNGGLMMRDWKDGRTMAASG